MLLDLPPAQSGVDHAEPLDGNMNVSLVAPLIDAREEQIPIDRVLLGVGSAR